MNSIWNFFILFLIIQCTINKISALNDAYITCNDVANSTMIGKVKKAFSSAAPLQNLNKIKLYLFTNSHKDMIKLDLDNLKTFNKSSLNEEAKNFILIHGYRSNGLKPWILEIKEKLLDKVSIWFKIF